MDRYANSLIQGISAAAKGLGCNLLLGCGFSVTGNSPQRRSFWPVAGPGVDFVPVGPWNTNGLIIVPDELTDEQLQYVRDLLASGFPVIFTTPEGPGPVVAVDNTLGIRQAFAHLMEHGHRQIAFIAGNDNGQGDSQERLDAYRKALADAGLPADDRLVAFGEHRKEGGALAMKQILASGASFSALIASNDLSCLGAIESLTTAGRRIPEDIAVIGFDDILDARSLSPSLTTIRHPTFSLGYQAVLTLMDHIRGRRSGNLRVVVPPHLIIRQSCGCRPGRTEVHTAASSLGELAHEMAEASLIDAHNSQVEDLEAQSASILKAFVESLRRRETNITLDEIEHALAWTEEHGEDAHIWQAAIDVILGKLNTLLALAPVPDPVFAASLLDRVRLEISDRIQRQITRSLLSHMDMMDQLGQLTAELLTAINITDSAEILSRHLPKVGIKNALVARYVPDDEDRVSQGVVLFGAGFTPDFNGIQFDPRKFPIAQIYSSDEPYQLTILPLAMDDQTTGFVAFNAPNPELCAAIVHNLSAALRTSRLYRDALNGRRLAEDASQLKNRFLSMVSHELRTPLSLIVGLSEMVLREERKTTDLPASVARDIEQINLSAQHLGRLIGDVLDLASSEAGQLHLIRQPLDLAEVLQVVAAAGEQMARTKGLGWHAAIPASGPWVFGDRTRLRQVALNLISNAVKFTDQGDVTIGVSMDETHATVSVCDMGIGIPVSEQALIFQEFHRSERSIQGGYGGMGLGLAVSKQLVQHHGGTIGVESPIENNRGSRFYFTLPLMPVKDSDTLPASATPQTVILLTERGNTNTLLEQYLGERGFDFCVYQVDQDYDWLADIFGTNPAAVVMDYGLAARHGWEIIGMLKRLLSTDQIPVLVYSLNPEKNQGELLELNYLVKPVQLDQLTRELTRHGLGGQRTILVVDDDARILTIHTRMVEHAGYRAQQAHNGLEALTYLEQTPVPDLILLDLMMPEMDGFQLLDQMRARDETRNIPVVVVTGQVLTDADMDRLNRSVATILSKGMFSADETLMRIESALARQNGLGSAAQRFVRRAIAFIHAHFTEPVSREDIASHVAVSPDYLTDCFRQEMGVTPMTYLTRYRIQQAQKLLDTTGLNITEIAMETGFSDVSHFTRLFKREVGVSPHTYRRGQRPNPQS